MRNEGMLQKDGKTEAKTQMKCQRNSLLAGIAASALVAGTGIASAQDSSKGESPHGAAPHATQQMNRGGTSGQSSQGAQTQEHGSMSKQGQRVEDSGRATKGEKATAGENRVQKEEQNRSAQSHEQKGTTAGSNASQAGRAAQERNKSATENERANGRNSAQEREHMGGKNAAERNHGGTAAKERNRAGGGTNMNAQRGRTGMEGLQGNATGMNVQLNEQQRNEIRTSVIDARGAPRVSHVDFDVTVGTVIPRGKIHVVPVPETLVRIEPEWRGLPMSADNKNPLGYLACVAAGLMALATTAGARTQTGPPAPPAAGVAQVPAPTPQCNAPAELTRLTFPLRRTARRLARGEPLIKPPRGRSRPLRAPNTDRHSRSHAKRVRRRVDPAGTMSTPRSVSHRPSRR
jgi:hypothetical protein